MYIECFTFMVHVYNSCLFPMMYTIWLGYKLQVSKEILKIITYWTDGDIHVCFVCNFTPVYFSYWLNLYPTIVNTREDYRCVFRLVGKFAYPVNHEAVEYRVLKHHKTLYMNRVTRLCT